MLPGGYRVGKNTPAISRPGFYVAVLGLMACLLQRLRHGYLVVILDIYEKELRCESLFKFSIQINLSEKDFAHENPLTCKTDPRGVGGYIRGT